MPRLTTFLFTPKIRTPIRMIRTSFLRWLTTHLRHKFIFTISAVLLTSSLIFLLLFIHVYRNQLAQERSDASETVNRLLQASLENAMLKQDLDGLRGIIHRLGQQEDILDAFIINPAHEIRFASDLSWVGQPLSQIQSGDYVDLNKPFTQFVLNDHGEEVLRSVNPVRNKPECVRCHGSMESHPINGILFVDYDARPILQKARQSSMILITEGSLVVILAILTIGWFIHRYVLLPTQILVEASRALADGNLDVRVPVTSHDELGMLAMTFNQMAESLQDSLREVREQKLFLQSLIDAIPDGIRVIDGNHQIIQANHAYHQQLKLSNSSVNSTCYQSSHNRQHPCPATLLTCPWHEIRRTGQPIKTITNHERSDGKMLPVEVCAAPMLVELHGEEKLLIVESIRDLTQTIQFSHEQKLSSVGQLAAGVAHEIYNPLASIRLALQSTLRILGTPQPNLTEIHDYFILLDKQIDKCIDITQRLLKLSAYSSDTIQLVAMDEVIAETASLLLYESQERKVQIHIELEPDKEYRIFSTESDMRMLILNLFQNAFHAMPNGGQLQVHLDNLGNHLNLIVEDTGVGVQVQYLDKIFDPFFSHRADGVKGTGLGLSICQSIVERCKGNISVENHEHGCRFIIGLPVANV
jgi:signal transduction histidine kinase